MMACVFGEVAMYDSYERSWDWRAVGDEGMVNGCVVRYKFAVAATGESSWC